MARGQEPYREEWPLVVPAMNRRVHRSRLRRGELSLATGVDGRCAGSLKRFPGYELKKDFGLDVFWVGYAEVQNIANNDIYRGFFIGYDDAGTNKVDFYYGTGASSWSNFNVIADAGSSPKLSVAYNGKFAYVALEGSTPYVVYYDSGWQAKSMGCNYGGNTYTSLTAPGTATAATGGVLEDGTYRVAFRYYDSSRGVYSALSDATVDVSEGTGTAKITMSRGGAEAPYTDGYDEVHLYRSLSVEVAGDTYDAGVLYLDSTHALSVDDWSEDLGTTLEDGSLVYQEIYDDFRDDVGMPPNAGAVAIFEGVTFLGSDDSELPEMQFSSLHDYEPEVFPLGNTYRWNGDMGYVLAWARAGDMLYGWTRNAAFRVAKLGRQITINKVQGGRGITGRGGVTGVGKDVIAMTSEGLMRLDAKTGNMESVGAVERLLFDHDEWGTTLDDVVIVNDPAMGATFVYNTNTGKEEAIVLWHLTGGVTMLDDCQFVWATEGRDPHGDTDVWRHYVITSTGHLLYPQDTGEPYYSMFGFNGSACAGTIDSVVGDDVVIDPDPGWTDAELENAYMYVWNSNDSSTAIQKRKMVQFKALGQIELESAFDPAPKSGWYYAVAPVNFAVRGWPMGAPRRDMVDFSRKLATAVGVMFDSVAPDDGGTIESTGIDLIARVGLCRNFETAPSAADFMVVDDDQSSDSRFMPINLDGVALEPHIEFCIPLLGFELLGVTIDGTMVQTRKVGS